MNNRAVHCLYAGMLVLVFAYTSAAAYAAKAPALTPFLADSATNTGIGVVICPGGSYSWLDTKNEGRGTAEWLQQQGINAFVLQYRVANISAYVLWYRFWGIGNKYPDMLEDAEWALAEVYRQADSLRIDTTRIGVMGFSAGGHLTMMSYLYNRTPYRPHFLAPIYPVVTMSDKQLTHKRSRRGALGVWRQFDHSMRDSLSIEKHITDDCPPVFLVNCKDDPTVRYENALLLDSALAAHNVPHRHILYESGGHGFGVSESKGTEESRQWKKAFLEWILNLNR